MTPFKEIYEYAILTIQDYKMDNLYKLNQEAYYAIFEGYLKKAVAEFTKCMVPLEMDEENKCFVADLPTQVIKILSDYIQIFWMTRETQNVLGFNAKLSNKEFQTYSEAQNLKSKMDYLIFLKESVSQSISEYIIANPKSWEDAFKM